MTDLKTAHAHAQNPPALQTDRKADESFVAYMTRVAHMGEDARVQVAQALRAEILAEGQKPDPVICSPLEKPCPPQTEERLSLPPFALKDDPDFIYLKKAGIAFLTSKSADMHEWMSREGHLWRINGIADHNDILSKATNYALRDTNTSPFKSRNP